MGLDLARQGLENALLLGRGLEGGLDPALLSSTTAIGSMNSVAADALWSWTMPGTRPLASARMGIT